MYGEFSVSNATGSFQYHCSVASQMNPFADEPSSSQETDPQARYDGYISGSCFAIANELEI